MPAALGLCMDGAACLRFKSMRALAVDYALTKQGNEWHGANGKPGPRQHANVPDGICFIAE